MVEGVWSEGSELGRQLIAERVSVCTKVEGARVRLRGGGWEEEGEKRVVPSFISSQLTVSIIWVSTAQNRNITKYMVSCLEGTHTLCVQNVTPDGCLPL